MFLLCRIDLEKFVYSYRVQNKWMKLFSSIGSRFKLFRLMREVRNSYLYSVQFFASPSSEVGDIRNLNKCHLKDLIRSAFLSREDAFWNCDPVTQIWRTCSIADLLWENKGNNNLRGIRGHTFCCSSRNAKAIRLAGASWSSLSVTVIYQRCYQLKKPISQFEKKAFQIVSALLWHNWSFVFFGFVELVQNGKFTKIDFLPFEL